MSHTADAAMLNKMSPFFTLIFSAIFLREKVKPKQALAIIGAFIGAMFVIKPSFSNVELLPSLAGFAGGIGAGAAYTCVRHMGNKGENGHFTVFFFSAFSVAVTAVCRRRSVWHYGGIYFCPEQRDFRLRLFKYYLHRD